MEEPEEEFVIPELPNSKFDDEVPITIVERKAWGAKPPKNEAPMHMPIRKVRYTYENLNTYDDYITKALRKCQDHYMDNKMLNDIPYNFLVSEGGVIFEGRGWATSPAYSGNKGDALDIAFIGDYSGEHNTPSFDMLDAGLSLVKKGIREMMVHPQYETIPIITGKTLTWKQKTFF